MRFATSSTSRPSSEARAFSTSVTTSPMPSTREAKRAGGDSSSASRRSPAGGGDPPERLQAFAGGDQLEREPGHLAHGEHGAAAAVGVHLRDDDAGALD